MKKSYITPEIIFMEADACEPLCGSINNKPQGDAEYGIGGGLTGGNHYNNGDISAGDGEFEQHAKQGDFFCDNFEYELDF